MKAVIMAGGEGTRLRPVTLTRPKPLVPVAGEACIDYVIRALVQAGIREIIITTGFRANEILSHTGGGSRYGNINITFSIEDTPLGTAGGVKRMERYLDDTFIVASGDVVADVDFTSLIEFHKMRNAEATMALTTVDDPTGFGIVGLDSNGRINRFKEKPAPGEVFSNLINAGIYILEPSALELIPESTKFDFSKELFPKMLEQERMLFAKTITGLWKDIGDPFDLIETNMLMIERKGGFVGPYTRDHFNDVELQEPFMACEGVEIAPGSKVIRSALYPGAEIGRAEVSDSIILDRTNVGEGSRIRNSFIGKNVNIGASCLIEDSVIGDDQVIPPGSSMKGVLLPEG